MAGPPVFESVEAKIIELHFGHHAHDQTVALLRAGKPLVSRCIREFHCSDVIPNALTIGRPSKRSSELVAFIEALLFKTRGYRCQNIK
jgi:hypothetical protein